MSFVLTGSWRWKPSLSVVVSVHMSCAFLSFAISIIIFTLIVRVVHLEEPLAPSLFVFLDLRLCVCPHVLVYLDVTGNTQQTNIVDVVA